MSKSSRQKRIFRLATELADHVEKISRPVQPEDLIGWIGCHVPVTEEEHQEDVAEMDRLYPARQTEGKSQFNRLRSILGMENASLRDVLAVVIERLSRNER